MVVYSRHDAICGTGFIRESATSANDAYPVQQGRISNTASLNHSVISAPHHLPPEPTLRRRQNLRRDTRHIPQPNPGLITPLHHTQRRTRPVQMAQPRIIQRHILRPMQHRQNLMRQPLPQRPVLGYVMMNQQRKRPRLADHQLLLPLAIGLQPHNPTLIGIQLERRTLTQGLAHQTGKV